MKRFFSWLTRKKSPQKAPPAQELLQSGRHKSPRRVSQALPRQQPEFVEFDDSSLGRIESSGPGKNVLIRNKYVREDTGTHETLKILDDSMIETNEETGIDPYNTGQFDRSRNWDKRFRKN